MIDIINIDKNELILNELSVGEYLYLSEMNKNGSINLIDESIIGHINYHSLENKGFIKIMENQVVVREKARELFKPNIDNFHRFLNTFPIKTPKGRYLSPAGTEGVAVNALKKKWVHLFKENKVKEDHVIKVLEAEIQFRKKNNDLEFMTACEAWLNGAFYEKYEYLLQDHKDIEESNNYERM